MNKESSRSHSVFVLQLCMKSVRDGVTTRKFSRFNLIDLAGSGEFDCPTPPRF